MLSKKPSDKKNNFNPFDTRDSRAVAIDSTLNKILELKQDIENMKREINSIVENRFNG